MPIYYYKNWSIEIWENRDGTFSYRATTASKMLSDKVDADDIFHALEKIEKECDK